MLIHHIFHSGFLVITDHSALLFDWYTGELPQIPADLDLYVFCSHVHEDHYNSRIWSLQLSHPEVIYILDEGITDVQNHPEARILTVKPDMCYEIAGRIIRHCRLDEVETAFTREEDEGADAYGEREALRIYTLESTDLGVAFCVETEDKRIYHAGDLNIWYWNDEPEEDNIESEKKCRSRMKSRADLLRRETYVPDPFSPTDLVSDTAASIRDEEKNAEEEEGSSVLGTAGNIAESEADLSDLGTDGSFGEENEPYLLDVAFVPLDYRLEEHAPRCLAAFMEILGAEYVFPMHYWRRKEQVMEYLKDPRLSPYRDRILFDDEVEII